MGVGARHECEEGRTARVSSPSSLSSYMSSLLVTAVSAISLVPFLSDTFWFKIKKMRNFSKACLHPFHRLLALSRFLMFREETGLSLINYWNTAYFYAHFQYSNKVSIIKFFKIFLIFSNILQCAFIKLYTTRDEDTCHSRAHRYTLLPLLLPTVAVVSGTRMFRATGLPYPPPIPLRLLHSFSTAADLSISSHSLFLIILLLLLLRPLSLSYILHFALSPSHSVRLARAPGPAFLSPGNCSNFDPRDTTRPVGMWTLHMCAPVSLTRESRKAIEYA